MEKKAVYDAYFCGHYDHSFTEKDVHEVRSMERNLSNPWNDVWEYTRNGLPCEQAPTLPESKYNYL